MVALQVNQHNPEVAKLFAEQDIDIYNSKGFWQLFIDGFWWDLSSYMISMCSLCIFIIFILFIKVIISLVPLIFKLFAAPPKRFKLI